MRVGSLATALGVLRSEGTEDNVSLSGRTLGAYELGERIGSGGFGVVYRAKHARTEREVAIKVLHLDRCTDPDMVSRFIDEARTVNKLALPGIVDIFDFGFEGDRHYLAMELLSGQSLARLLDVRGHLPLDEALPILRRLAEFIDAIHRAGACHRDLKPANVMLVDDGSIKLIDFGLSRLSRDVDRTATREVFGTPAYLSPEQCRGLSGDQRSDRYAFGVIAYRVLTGRLPFEGDALAMALAHVGSVPKKPSRHRRLSREVDDAILNLLAKEPDGRPDLMTSVDRIASRRVPLRTVAGGAAVLALGSALAYVALRDTRPLPIDPSTVRVVRQRDVFMWNTFSLHPDGAFLDAQTINEGTIKIAWDGSKDQPVVGGLYGSYLPDGRRVSESNDGVLSVPVAGGDGHTLGTGWFPEVCARGTKLAMMQNDVLQVLDIATEAATELVPMAGAWGHRWSPNCDALVWTNNDGIHLTQLDGTSTLLPVEHAGPIKVLAGAALLDPSTVAYCGRRTDGNVELRVHYLDGRSDDTALLDLGRNRQGCTMAASVDGSRVVVGALGSVLSFKVIDQTTGERHEVIKDETGTGRVLAFTDEQHFVYATWPLAVSPSAEPPKPAEVATPLTLDSVSITDGSRTAMKPCRGTIAATRYRESLSWVSLEGDAFSLRARDCSQVATMPRPYPGVWSAPACAGERCVASWFDRGDIVAYELLPTPHEIARLPHERTTRSGVQTPAIALSPDGARLAMYRKDDGVFYVINVVDGAAREVRIGESIKTPLNNLFWIDATTLTFSAASYGIGRATLDAAGSLAITKTIDMFGASALSPSGGQLVAFDFAQPTQLWFIELPR